jgi:AAA domain-containing protein
MTKETETAEDAAFWTSLGLPADGKEIVNESAPRRERRPLEPWSWADLDAEPDTSWLVGDQDKPVLIEDGLWLIFGRYKTGKTYFAMEQAFCIAFGLPFHGLPVKQARAAYVIAEGGKKRHQKRFAAIYEKHAEAMKAVGFANAEAALNSGNFLLITSAVNLADPDKEIGVGALIEELAGHGGVGVIYLDTWARMLAASAGHASDKELVPLAIAGADKLQKQFACAVVLIGHVPHAKDAQDRPVGMNELPGALDGAIISDKDGEGPDAWFKFKCTIQRHAMDGFAIIAKMVEMSNADNEAVLADSAPGDYNEARRSEAWRVLIRELERLGGSSADEPWREAVRVTGLWAKDIKGEPTKPDTWRKKWTRQRDLMVTDKALDKRGDTYSVRAVTEAQGDFGV